MKRGYKIKIVDMPRNKPLDLKERMNIAKNSIKSRLMRPIRKTEYGLNEEYDLPKTTAVNRYANAYEAKTGKVRGINSSYTSSVRSKSDFSYSASLGIEGEIDFMNLVKEIVKVTYTQSLKKESLLLKISDLIREIDVFIDTKFDAMLSSVKQNKDIEIDISEAYLKGSDIEKIKEDIAKTYANVFSGDSNEIQTCISKLKDNMSEYIDFIKLDTKKEIEKKDKNLNIYDILVKTYLENKDEAKYIYGQIKNFVEKLDSFVGALNKFNLRLYNLIMSIDTSSIRKNLAKTKSIENARKEYHEKYYGKEQDYGNDKNIYEIKINTPETESQNEYTKITSHKNTNNENTATENNKSTTSKNENNERNIEFIKFSNGDDDD